MRMLRALALGLLIGSSPNWSLGSQASTRTGEAGTTQGPALFLGNEASPPINFMKDGRPAGVVVDLASEFTIFTTTRH